MLDLLELFLTLKRKKVYNSVIVCVKKKSSNIIYNVKKKTCLGVLDQGKRGDDYETGLKEGEVINQLQNIPELFCYYT